MPVAELSESLKKRVLASQKSEITEHIIYKRLARRAKDPHNKEILNKISVDELAHFNFWKEYTNEDVKPDMFKIRKYLFISWLLGLTFGIKLMEREEGEMQISYEEIVDSIPEAKHILEEEHLHERQLIELLKEKRLQYIGSIVLGLNDALVELTGALAGLTLVLQRTELIAFAALITGIAASFSMAASQYLSIKTEEGRGLQAINAAVYTGIAYIFTVLFLVAPFFLFSNAFLCLGISVGNSIIIISLFNFYLSVAKDVSFKRRFSEMIILSLGVATLTFIIAYLLRKVLDVSI